LERTTWGGREGRKRGTGFQNRIKELIYIFESFLCWKGAHKAGSVARGETLGRTELQKKG